MNVKLTIEKIENRYIYGYAVADNCDSKQVIDFGAQRFDYLRKILKPGMTINALEATQLINHAVLFPLYIIVEPDFLLDISAVAACFKEYGHHPLNYTIGRLSKAETTQPILLGNYAGAALDALVGPESRESSGAFDFGAVLRKCFEQQPLEYISCKDFNGTQFKKDALLQAENIKEIVDALKNDYDLEKVLLEPSFVCEALGLQGRVDMMTSDLKLLIEQKSGKNYNLANSLMSDIGYHVESHYVQLLLYYLVLYFNFGVKREDIDFYLLYSKYAMPTGLLPVEFHDALVNEALKVRNQIVATELMIADKGFGSVRALLRSEVVNTRGSRSNLWTRYQKPQLDETLSVLRTSASNTQESGGQSNTVERNLFKDPRELLLKYYDTMATFVYREQKASWLGESTEQVTAVSYLWKMDLKEKIERGEILGAADLIHSQNENDFLPNFRRGDSIYYYEYEEGKPDVRKAFLRKGNILKLTAEEVTVRLQNPSETLTLSLTDVGKPEGKEKMWAIEHSASNSQTAASLRSLTAFLQTDEERQALLLGQREPRVDKNKTLTQQYSPDYDDIVLRMKQAKDYFLLIGPPGTGKTSQALKFMVTELLAENGEQDGNGEGALLLLSYTNRAVDEICEMLYGAGIEFLRIGNEHATDEQWQPMLLSTRVKENSSLALLKEEILKAKVIVGTTSMISARTYLFGLKTFSTAIIDESSQILEPNIIGILSQNIGKFVLIGDYKQLPAVVVQSPEDSKVDDESMHEICLTDCRNSLFERLINIERKAGREQFIGLLRKQGRMHPDIAEFANEHFYKEEDLQIVPLRHQLEDCPIIPATEGLGEDLDSAYDWLYKERMTFIDIASSHAEGAREGLKSNVAEAKEAARIVEEVRKRYGAEFNARKTIGIIVPYRNQIATIRRELERYNNPEYLKISVDTVERYQGSQRDVIIYSFTISKESQLGFLTANTFIENGRPIDRKLNVAITRARKQFVALGDKGIVGKNELFYELIKNCTLHSECAQKTD